MTDNQQKKLKGPSHSLHYTTESTHARLFPQPSGEYKFKFEFPFDERVLVVRNSSVSVASLIQQM